MIFKLLTFPVSGPISALTAVSRTILNEAEAQLYDEGNIRRAMMRLEQELEAGRLTEDEFERQEDVLLERLMEARARKAEGA